MRDRFTLSLSLFPALALSLLLIATPAQALGVSAEVGMMNFGVRGNTDILSPGGYTSLPGTYIGFRSFAPFKAVTFDDNTGFLMSVIGTSANAFTASQEAQKDAQREANNRARATGKDVTVTKGYTYKTVNAPGAHSYITFGQGDAVGGEVSFDGKTLVTSPGLTTKLTYIEVGAPWPKFSLWSLPGLSSLKVKRTIWNDPDLRFLMAVTLNNYEAKGTASASKEVVFISRKDGMIAMPMVLSAEFRPIGNVTVTPEIGYDLISSLAAMFAKGNHGFSYGLTVNYEPVQHAILQARVKGIASNLTNEPYDSVITTVGAGVSF